MGPPGRALLEHLRVIATEKKVTFVQLRLNAPPCQNVKSTGVQNFLSARRPSDSALAHDGVTGLADDRGRRLPRLRPLVRPQIHEGAPGLLVQDVHLLLQRVPGGRQQPHVLHGEWALRGPAAGPIVSGSRTRDMTLARGRVSGTLYTLSPSCAGAD